MKAEEKARFVILAARPSFGRSRGLIGRNTFMPVLLAVLAFGMGFAPGAQASKNIVGFFGEDGSAAGEFSIPRGVAVSETGAGPGADSGDLYINDVRNDRISQFDSLGNFIRLFGRDVVISGPDNTGANEQQTVNVPSGVTGGTYKLAITSGVGQGSIQGGSNIVTGFTTQTGSFQVGDVVTPNFGQLPENTKITAVGNKTLTLSAPSPSGFNNATLTATATTESINYDAAANTGAGAANLQASLEALPGVGVGNISVSGGPGASGTPYTVTFDGGIFGHNDIAPMTIPISQLTGGIASVATVTEGGGPEICQGSSADVCQLPVDDASRRGAAAFLESANGIAMDQANGDIFLTDQGLQRISIFGSDGKFQGAFGWGVATGGESLEFCSTDCRAGRPGDGAGQFAEYSPRRLAVDPTTGNVFVGDERNNRVEEFSFTRNGSGEVTGVAFVLGFGWGVDTGANAFETCTTASTCNAGQYSEHVGAVAPEAIAVSSTGVVYVVDQISGTVQSFTPSGGSFTPAIFDPTDLSGTSFEDRPSDVAIGPNDHVFVMKRFPAGASTCLDGTPSVAESRIVEVSAVGTLLDTHIPCARIGFGFGFTVDASTGNIFLGAQRPGPTPFSESIDTIYFLGDTGPPSATIDSVTPNASGATVTGRINPGGPLGAYPNPPTSTYQLEYKKSSDSTWIPWSVPINIGAGATDVPVTVHLGLLQGNTSYDLRLVATKQYGEGSDVTAPQTFQTLPVAPSVDAFSSSGVTATTADLNAQINPHGAATSYHFEYGPTTSYGSVSPAPDEAIGDAQGDQTVSVHLDGLQKGVVYHFRVVATNPTGTTVSGDQTFNFFPPSCPNATVRQQNGSDYLPDCRGYELVSPGETGNIILVSTGVPAPYATDPPRFSFGGFLGGITGTEPTNAFGADTYVSTRTSSGWVTHLVGVRGSEARATSQLVGDLGLDTFIDFAGGREPATNAPFVWDANGDPLGRWPANLASVPNGDSTKGAYQPSPDFSHLAFSSRNVDFDPEGHGLTVAPGSAYDYDTKTGSITLISKDEHGAPIAQEPTNSNSEEFIQFPGTNEERPTRINPGVSTNGSHILMSTASSSAFDAPTRLYMRVGDAITYEVSKGQDVDYVGMTADGSKVYFTASQQLTPEDQDASTDLYMWSEATDSLTLLSTGSGAGNSDGCVATAGWTSKCDVEPIAVSNSDRGDNSIAPQSGDIYFYSPELLDGPGNGLEGAQNLYVYRNGQPHFVAIAALSRIQVSPTGDHAAFITPARLTSYDNAGFAEMYSYDPSNDRILCVSCPITGEAPTANVDGSKKGLFMSNDGRTFFSTTDALVPQDTNNLIDVYEYVDGRPQLITAGTGAADERAGNGAGESAGFVGVSADGVNAYFSTFDTLVPQDHNGQFLKFYDARTGGGFPLPPSGAPCEAADECHGAGSEPPAPPLITSKGDLGSGGNALSPHSSGPHKHQRKKHRHRKKASHRSRGQRHRIESGR